jgi:hypothetical protein
MTISALGSALGGLSAAQDRFAASTDAVTRATLPGSRSDLVAAVGQSQLAAQAVDVDVASLQGALDTEHTLIDLFA